MREARVSISDSEFETMGIEGLVSLCQEAGIRDFEELVCRGVGAVVRVEVETRLDEERLSSLECVDQWEHVAEIDGTQLYVIAFTAPELPEDLADEMDDLVGTCDPVVNERGATLSFVGSQEAIAGTVSEYETAGVSPDLQKLDVYEGRERPIDDLTDRQREVIQTAYDEGYYEVPREVTTGDIAAELGVDPSTVAEHLQRAERNLLSHHL
ncbi:helix-turn-helix domain-containing protein [Halorussus salinisoli]|uniref:helix-turn-helix domain-containing protein n=1 Tax=Halorussus salinisoli TaxID=2558242 RepID=UPI0010C17E6A|nr:helix-turn-helix domain-containing protein [Halorussus salinisoli]